MAKKLAPNYVGLNPMTGLPVSEKQEEINLKALEQSFLTTGTFPGQPSLPELGGQPLFGVTPEELSILPKFGGWSKEAAEDVRAEQQSVGEGLMYGAARLGLTTATKALSGVSSLGEFLFNTARAVSEGSFNPYADTPITDDINSVEEAIKKAFPIYNTKADEKKNFLMRAVTDLDFWTNDMVDGAAFMASAMLTGYGASKALGPLTKAYYGSRLKNATALGMEELAGLEKAAMAGDGKAIEILQANALAQGKLAKNINTFNQVTTSAFSRSVESLAEGRQTYQKVYQDLIDKGRDAQYAETEAAKAAMMTTGLNMLLMPLDYQQYSGLFKTFSKSKEALLKVGKDGALELGIPSFGKALAKHVGKNAFSEGILEEGLQAAMQKYSEKRYLGEYKPEEDSGVFSVLEEYFKGFATKEGWDAMGAGMILGGLFGGAMEARGEAGKQTREKAAYLKEMIQNNDYLKTDMSEYVITDEKTGKKKINTAKVVGLISQQIKDGYFSKEMVKALGNDYEEAYKALDNIRFSNWAYAHFEAGLGDNLMSKIDSLDNMNEKELRDMGIIYDDMRNSKGAQVSSKEVVDRYRQKALEYEQIYNDLNLRFDIPNRAVGRQLFDEAVLQKETSTSLNNISRKIEDLRSKISTSAMDMGTPEFVEEFEPREKGPMSMEERDLAMQINRKKDLINTLRDSYKRVDELTRPSNLTKEKQAEASAKDLEEKINKVSEQTKKQEDAAKKAADAQVATFFNDNGDKVFKDVEFNGTKKDYQFARDAEGNIDPNFLQPVGGGPKVSVKLLAPLIDTSKSVTQEVYEKELNIQGRIAAIEKLIQEDISKGVANKKQIQDLEDQILDALIGIEELEKYTRGKDKKYRRIGVAGSKVYTEEEYQKLLNDLIALRDLYQQEIDFLENANTELKENINFLRDYKSYLADPAITIQEKLESLNAFEEGAIADMIKYSDTTVKELEDLLDQNSKALEAGKTRLSYLDNLIAAVKDILKGRKLERAAVASRLDILNNLEEFLDTVPPQFLAELQEGDLEFLKFLNRKEQLTENQRVLVNERAKMFLKEHPEISDMLIEWSNETLSQTAKKKTLDQEIKELNETLALAVIEQQELSAALQQYIDAVEYAKKAAPALADAQTFDRNYNRLVKAFSGIKTRAEKMLENKKENAVKQANKTANRGTGEVEPNNLTEEEFSKGFDPIRDIINVLNGTAGTNVIGLTDVLTQEPELVRWFRFTENTDPADGNYYLRAVSKKNNPFPDQIKDSDFFNETTIMLVLYQNDQPVVQDGKLVYTRMHETPSLAEFSKKYSNKNKYTDEQLTDLFDSYSKLRDRILTTIDPVSGKKDNIEKNKKADLEQLKTIPPSNYIKITGNEKDLLKKFREYLTDVLGWESMSIGFSKGNLTLDYLGTELKIPASVNILAGNNAILDINVEDVIEAKYNVELAAIGKTADSIYFAVTGKSAGVKTKTDENGNPLQPMPVLNRVVESESELDKVNLVVVEADTVEIDGKVFEHKSRKKGFVVIGHKGQVVNVNLPTMAEIPGALTFLMGNVEALFDAKNNEDFKKLYGRIKSLILFGNIEGSDADTQRIYFDSKKKALFFKGQFYTKDQLDKEMLKEFLGQKLFNVSKKALQSNAPYIDPLTGKKHSSYKVYLMTSQGRTLEQIPVKIKLATLSEQQFRSVYFTFDFQSPTSTPKVPEPSVVLEPEETASVLNIDDQGPDTGDIDFAAFEEAQKMGLVGGVKPPVAQQAIEESEKIAAAMAQGIVPVVEDVASSIDITPSSDTTSEDPDELKKIYESEEPASTEELDFEEAWFKAAFPKFADQYKRIKGVLSGGAIGKVTAAGQTLISDLAVAGTTYHEAWHIVSQFLLTPEERKALYDNYNKETGQNLTYDQIEEAVAEDFRAFMLTSDVSIPTQKSIFERLLDLIKNFFLKLVGKDPDSKKNLQTLFKNIKTGRFANASLVSKPGKSFNKITGKSADFTVELNNALTKVFLDILFNNKDFSIDTLKKLNRFKTSNLYDKMFDQLLANFAKENFVNGNITDVPNDILKANPKITKEQWSKVPNKSAVSPVYRALANIAFLYDKNPEAKAAARKEATAQFERHLTQFGLLINSREVEEKLNPDTDNAETQGRNAPDYIDSIKFSTKNGLSNPVKMLLFSLTKREFTVNAKGERVSTPQRSKMLKVKVTENFENVINFLQEKLSGSTTLEEMYDVLNNLRSTKAFIPELLRTLKLEGPGIAGPLSPVLTKDQAALQIDFFQQFAKTKHEFLLTLVNPDTGEVYNINSNSTSLKDKMVSIWKANSKTDIDAGKSAYKLENGRYVFDSTKYNNFLKSKIILPGTTIPVPFNINNFEHVVEALRFLGVPLAKNAGRYTEQERKIVKAAFNKIIEYYVKQDVGLEDMFSSPLVRSSISDLSAVELKYTDEAIELSHQNPDGETVYGVTLNNYLSLVLNKIQKGGLKAAPHLANDPNLKNSLWVKMLEKDPSAIKLVILEGQKLREFGQDGSTTSKLEPTDYLVTLINAYLEDVYPLIRAGDKSLEYGFKVSMPDVTTKYMDYLKGYLSDELNRIVTFNEGKGRQYAYYEKQAGELMYFYYLKMPQGINLSSLKRSDINGIVNNPAITSQIEEYLKSKMQENLDLLLDYKVLESSTDGYVNNGIKPEKLSKKATELDVKNLVKEFTIKSLIANFEETKLFLGDLAFYNHSKNDGPKRVGGMVGTKKIAVTGANVDNYLNAQYSRSDKKSDGKINVLTLSDPISPVGTFIKNASEATGIPESSSFFDEFRNTKSADGQGYISLPEYREFCIRLGGNYWSAAHEKAYPKLLAGESLTRAELQLFQPLKPQYFGPQNYSSSVGYNGFAPIFLKFSVIPLLPAAIKNSPELQMINKIMMDNGIGIVTFQSAVKTGAIVNSLKDLNEDPTMELNTSEINYEYFGTQLDIAPEFKRDLTFGTQFRKLLHIDLFENGEAKTIRVFNKATNKLEEKSSKELLDSWVDTIDEMVKEDKNNLLDKLEIVQTGDTYTIKNIVKFRDQVLQEVTKRGLSENALEGILESLSEIDPSLDALSNKVKIENILMSLVNNNLVRQKTFGDMKVQVSGYGFNKPSTDPTKVETSKKLRFYSYNKGNLTVNAMEVMLPHWFKELYGTNVNIEDIDPRLLTLVGYRIPTGGRNYMEVMKVVGFLPPEAGSTIVVPELFPAKSGSDFDIDKLSIMIPNYRVEVDESGAIDYINNAVKKFLKGEPFKNLTEDNFEYLDELLDKPKDQMASIVEAAIRNAYTEYLSKASKKIVYVSPKEQTKAGRQNKLIEIAESIITSPDNYKSLITPNTSSTLKNLADEISKKGPKKGMGTMLEFKTNFETAVEYWSGKEGIGIAALYNTHHVLSQEVNLYVPAGTFLNISTGRTSSRASINLPHNKSKDGGISFAGEYDSRGAKGKRISEMINEFLSAYVDVTKEAFIIDLNASTDTANIWFTLLRAGVPVETIGYFMNQPIIKDFYKEVNIYKSQIMKDREMYTSMIFEKIALKYNLYKPSGKNSLTNFIAGMFSQPDITITKDSLVNNMTAGKDNVELNAKIFTELLKYQELSNNLSDLQKASVFDTAGVGKTRWHSKVMIDRVTNTLDNTYFANAEKTFTDTIIRPFYETAGKLGANIYNSLYVADSSKAKSVMNRIMDVANLKRDVDESAQVLAYAENEFITYILSSIAHSNDPSKPKVPMSADIARLFTGPASMANRLQGIKAMPKYSKNLIVSELIPIINSNRASTDNVKLYDAFFNSYQEDLLLQAFDEILNAQEPEVRDFANDLMKLMVMQGGVNRGINSLYKLLPNSKFIPTISKVLINQVKKSTIDINNFYDEFFMNNWHNELIVPYVKPSSSNILQNSEMFHVKSARFRNYPYIRTRVYKKGFTTSQIEKMKNDKVSPDIYSEMALFRKVSESETISSFERIEKRGNGSLLKEYYNDATKPSVIAENLYKSRAITISKPITSVQTEPTSISSQKTINIYAGTGENAELSNFAIRPFKHLGIKFDSVEQAFQYYKTEFSPKNEHNKAVASVIKDTTDGKRLRELGKEFRGLNQKVWDNMSPTIMKALLKDSFQQNPDALNKLLSTGNATLTHTQDKTRWGTEFPKLLMEVRAELAGSQVTDSTSSQKTSVRQIDFQEDQNTGYAERTKKNASADATIALAVDFTSAGEKLTKSSVLNQGKKYIPRNLDEMFSSVDPFDLNKGYELNDKFIFQIAEGIVTDLNSVNAKTLNIAGNGIYTMKRKYSQDLLDQAVERLLEYVIYSDNLKNKIVSIRTGGQTGIDEAGAKAGIKLGIPTTILAPKGWKFRDISGKDISSEQAFKSRFVSSSAVEQWAKYGNALVSKYGPGIKDAWSRFNSEERAYKIKCVTGK